MLQRLQVFTHAPVFVACSGGRDSVCLAHAFAQLCPQNTTVLHINHHLQDDCDQWQRFVQALCNKWQVRFMVRHVYPKNNEQSARTARYDAFVDALPAFANLFLAHHEQDLTETILMRLVNGTGLFGIHGMSAMRLHQKYTNSSGNFDLDTHDNNCYHDCNYSHMHHDDQYRHYALNDNGGDNKAIYICRPWLEVTRAQINAYIKQHNLDYIDDPTNISGSTRAFLRTHILPSLEKINPKALSNIAKSAQNIARHAPIISALVRQILQQCTKMHHQMHTLDIDVLFKTCDVMVSNNLSLHNTSDGKGNYNNHGNNDEHSSSNSHYCDNYRGGDHGHLLCSYQKDSHALLCDALAFFVQHNNAHRPNYDTIQQIYALICRTDHDHNTQILHQDASFDQSVMIYRYQNTLYRINLPLWQMLKTIIPFNTQSHCQNASGHMAAKKGVDIIQKVNKNDKIAYKHRKLCGKKLYQSYKIAPIFRPHLYLVRYQNTDFVASVYHTWDLLGNLQKNLHLLVYA